MTMPTEGEVRQATGLDYWKLRYARHHEKVPGTSNKSLKEQQAEYDQKFNFIIPRLDIMDNEHVIDFGCGTGWYARHFQPNKYLGLDPVTQAVHIAAKNNPDHRFEVDNGFCGIRSELIICFTVLQHIRNLEETIKRFDCKRLAIYENTSVNKDKSYIFFRTEDWYQNTIEQTINMELVDCDSHYVKTKNNMGYISEEKHSLFIFERL